MSLDHGLLNLPLSKRGNIDAEIDRHKKQQSLLAKQQGQVYRAIRMRDSADRRLANELIAALSDERIAELARALLIPRRSVRKRLRESASLNPRATLAALQRELRARMPLPEPPK